MTDLTQAKVEQAMYQRGKDAALARMADAEAGGKAHQNRYASLVHDKFTLPMAALIESHIASSKPGKHRGHIILLKPLDPEKVSAVAVRVLLNGLLTGKDPNHRELGYAVGTGIHKELVLAQIEDAAPELYHTLMRDISRRRSTDERHRLAVFKDQAKKAGIELAEWGVGARDQVGLYILGLAEDLGMLELAPVMTVNKRVQYRDVTLTDQVLDTIDQIKGFIAETSPMYGPCVEPPKPWTNNLDGGFHSVTLKRVHRHMVKCSPTARPRVRDTDMPIVRSAVNALQDTRWAINKPVLELVRAMEAAGVETEDVRSRRADAKPERPQWMDEVPKEDMDPAQQAALTDWKRSMAEWYTAKKLATTAFGRFYTTMNQATEFQDAPFIHFVWFADSRGRLYPMTYGVNPQGSDLQKALLHFADGKPLVNDDAIKWFLVQGANKFGFDKAKLQERAQWVRDRHDQIMAFAAAPLDNLGWKDADKPLQFIAWCFEYRQWVEDPGFASRLPVSMDGSCNGLQNFSAMLRDERGGKATNLTANASSNDIYAEVAESAMARLRAFPDDAANFRARWLEHGISRKVTKRPVMTTPYGVTCGTAAKYVGIDYLSDKHVLHPFEKREFSASARYVMSAVWPAIGDVVVKSRVAMKWLRAASRKIILEQIERGDADPLIEWVTPSGFLATQGYFEIDIHRINTLLHGEVKIRVAKENDTPDVTRHASGMAPNFIHSMDAAHLHLVAARAKAEGMHHLAMIHDDYGVHAADAEQFFHIIREEFVAMYENNDPLKQLRDRYPSLPPAPEKGTLDLKEVLRSEFFFS